MRANPVKERLAAGGVSVGIMMDEFNTSGIMRICDAAGADFVIFDLEHTGWGPDSVRAVMATARHASAWPMVRVQRAHYHLIAGALDAGAFGVMSPMIETAEEARLLVDSTKYPPQGRRGFGVVYSDDLSAGPAAWMEASNRETLVIAQIESVKGLENADAIAATEGVDIVWLGQYDLTSSMGIPGEFEHPRFVAALEQMLTVCGRHDKPVGFMATSTEQGRAVLARGFRVVAFGDIGVFEHALGAAISEAREQARALAGQ